MSTYRPLARRIVIAFVALVAVVSFLFSSGIIMAVRFVEQQLITDTLHGDLVIAMADLDAGRTIQLEPGLSFYFNQENTLENTQIADNPPPAWLDHLDSGFNEVFREDQVFHALKYIQDNEEFVLLRDQTDFEKREHILFIIVVAGFLLSVGSAWLLGRWMARHVLAPVTRLAQDVRDREALIDAPLLAPQFADDEVGRLAHAFDNAVGKLREALTREQMFTSDVSHELRTPLMVISTAAELLGAADNLTPRQCKQLDRIARASKDMHDLVKTFLLLARETRDDDLQTDSITLQTLAEELTRLWHSPAEEKGLTLELVTEQPDTGQYSAPLLRAVMSNLLRNAVYYTDEGFVRVVLMQKGFCVEDSGPGIVPEQHENMFKPFVRGAQTRGEGLGLGLSLVKRICERETWHVSLESMQPQGSRFVVRMEKQTTHSLA